ncbi:MAG: DUF433 domain-containing protein [Cytophagaceae bacterium]|nr:DUF433 domain-containing protein [Cytophagaceae bacterium]
MEATIIQSDRELLGGTPVFRGTRVPVQALFDYLENSTVEEFLIGYPHITREMVNEVINLAAETVLTSHFTNSRKFSVA